MGSSPAKATTSHDKPSTPTKKKPVKRTYKAPTSPRKKDTCAQCVACGHPDRGEGRRHQTHNKCCDGHPGVEGTDVNGHFPNCATLKTQSKKFDETLKRPRWFLFTATFSGRDAPVTWMEEIATWLREHAIEWTLVQERGAREKYRHLHALVLMYGSDDPKVKKKMTASIKLHLEVTTGTGLKLQWKPASNPVGALEYVCKEFNQPHFKAINHAGDTHTSSTVFKDAGTRWHADHGGAFKDLNLLRIDQLFPHIFTQASTHAPSLTDMKPGNWILLGIRSNQFNLHFSIVTPTKGSPTDPDRFARLLKIYNAPENATERDVYVIMCSMRDGIHGGNRRNLVAPDTNGIVNRELVNDPQWFNPRYRGMTLAECLVEWSDSRPTSTAVTAPQKLSFTQLYPWQKLVIKRLHQPEHPFFGRTINWFWEEDGNVGKSVLSGYLLANYRGIQIRGATSDGLFTVAEYVQDSGGGPHVIIVDIPRSETEINYQLLEYLKDGSFMSGKYKGKLVTYPRPHVVVFSNRLPDYEKLSLDRLKVQHIDEVIQQAHTADLSHPLHTQHSTTLIETDNDSSTDVQMSPRKAQKRRRTDDDPFLSDSDSDSDFFCAISTA